MNNFRVPGGVPTGGQFTEQPKGEAGVALAPAADPTPSHGDHAALWQSAATIEGYEDRIRCSDLLDAFEDSAGWNAEPVDISQIAYIGVHRFSDEDGDFCLEAEAYDRDGREVGNGATLGSAFRGEGVPRAFQAQVVPESLDRVAPEAVLDVEKLRRHDFHADLRRTQEQVLFEQLHALQESGHAEGYVITRDTIGDQVDFEASGLGVELTTAERAKAIAAVDLPDGRTWEPVHERMFYHAQRQVEEILDERETDR